MNRGNRLYSSFGGVSIVSRHVSYNLLSPRIRRDIKGRIVPYVAPEVKLNFKDGYRLLKSYVANRFWGPFKVVVPVAVFLVVFQSIFLQPPVRDLGNMALGVCAVVVGLMLLLEGLRMGVSPMGEILGNTLPKKWPMMGVLPVVFMLGLGSALTEPTWRVLLNSGDRVTAEATPYLYALLHGWSEWLILVSGISVGLAWVLATLQWFHGWHLKPVIMSAAVPPFVLTVLAWFFPHVKEVAALAWDMGALVLGPVGMTVMLALGRGMVSAVGRGNETAQGLGMIALAAMLPVTGVLGLAFIMVASVPVSSIVADAAVIGTQIIEPPWYAVTPWIELGLAVGAVVPLMIFIMLLFRFILQEQVRGVGILVYGVVLSIPGLILLNVGMTLSLSYSGSELHSWLITRLSPAGVDGTVSRFAPGVEVAGIFVLAWVIGFAATLAEPGLNILGSHVERHSHGVLRARTLRFPVAFGAGCSSVAGVGILLPGLDPVAFLLPLWLLLLLLTWMAPEGWIAMAWDSGGVIPGPVTVPLMLALGTGLGGGMLGLGLFALMALGSILALLLVGLWGRGTIGWSEIS
ncbi:MAG: DUF1538 family protein [Magnetococcales bacterium]|nr:DUF1538 family protein [Magnetococcales bacterium]MBF0631235.1 DUF1538 family protein [Magnetococcales bacterium]